MRCFRLVKITYLLVRSLWEIRYAYHMCWIVQVGEIDLPAITHYALRSADESQAKHLSAARLVGTSVWRLTNAHPQL